MAGQSSRSGRRTRDRSYGRPAPPQNRASRAGSTTRILFADSGRPAVVSAVRAAARRPSGSVATRGQLARIVTSWWLPADAACPLPQVDGAGLAFSVLQLRPGGPGNYPRPLRPHPTPCGRSAGHRFHASFRRGRRFYPGWRLGFRQSSFSHIARVPSARRPYASARPLVSWHALVPFTFQIQVSHQTQEYPPNPSRLHRGYDRAPRGAGWSWFGPVELALGWSLGLDASPRVKPAPTRFCASPS